MLCSVWDTRSQQVVKTLETSNTVLSLELINSGEQFMSAAGRDVKLWDANTFAVIKTFSFPYNVETASYSPAQQKFAVGGEDMWVHLHDFATGQEIDCNKGKVVLVQLKQSVSLVWALCVSAELHCTACLLHSCLSHTVMNLHPCVSKRHVGII